ncbi:NAD(P)H-dependent oxidoreductase [Thalassomonas haliotis]|uniref:NAD(P)H-dependent oxidoreductase n=1 Tax=Thalassomonas haliotis TaxID=485448 RepID=A0ABY7VGA2_9GAMM|nr:NAD(P)H-dependent oxidoreductase [Thalassomonas haliotis]WDE12056.1 NAD(P)H-dependent oxidoreductase [Thalassomonas haliotis]
MKTLVIFAHSDVKNSSIANSIIIDKLKTINDVEIRDLYQCYPDFKINVEAEQQAMIRADVVLFQYPFHWYSVPGILKEWIDRVFVRGFAYGSERKLDGKEFLVSTTIGGPKESYNKGGSNTFTVREFLKPLEQIACFTGMKFNKPITSHSMVFIPGGETTKKEIEQRVAQHAETIIALLSDLSAQYDGA